MDKKKSFIERLKGKDFREMAAALKWMHRRSAGYKPFLAVFTVIGIISILMGLASSVASKSLVDAVTGASASPVIQTACIFAALGIAKIILSAVSSRISEKISIRIGNELKSEVFERILGADWYSLSAFSNGDLLNRHSADVAAVSGSIISVVPTLFIRGIQFVLSFFIIFYYDKIMALLSLVSVPVTVLLSRILVSKMHAHNKKIRAYNGELLSFTSNTFQNIQHVKAFGLTAVFGSRLKSMYQKYTDINLEYNKLVILTSSAISLMGQLVSYLCFGWGIYRLYTGAITFGTMVLFLQLASSLSGAFSGVVGVVPSVIASTAAAGRLMEIWNLEQEKGGSGSKLADAGDRKLAVKLDHVSYSYDKKKNVLTDVQLEVKSGELTALVGQSGEGKTTVFRLLLALVKPDSGKAVVFDESKKDSEMLSFETRDLFAYVPQENRMFNGTVALNLRLSKADATDEEIEQALKAACAFDFIDELPDGINTVCGDGGTGFSEGQLQRLSIARALMSEAPFLLLDEATSALDAKTEKQVLNNIIRFGRQKAIIIATHKESVLSFCSSVYRITGEKVEKQ